MTAWRGRSRDRHVFIVRAATDPDLIDEVSGVALAVRRSQAGAATRIEAVVIETVGPFPAWLSAMQARGATEIHLHRSALPDESIEIARDLALADPGAPHPALRAA